jgi:hypothetical protein
MANAYAKGTDSRLQNLELIATGQSSEIEEIAAWLEERSAQTGRRLDEGVVWCLSELRKQAVLAEKAGKGEDVDGF